MYGWQKQFIGLFDLCFGLSVEDLYCVVCEIVNSFYFMLCMYYVMFGSQMIEFVDYVKGFELVFEDWVVLCQEYEYFDFFNFGGGIFVCMMFDFVELYVEIVSVIVGMVQVVVNWREVFEFDFVGEMGCYMMVEYVVYFFEIFEIKDNGLLLFWVFVDGLIMMLFFDIWVIGEYFVVLLLNYLDCFFQQVCFGGIICDSDDVYFQWQSVVKFYLFVVELDEMLWVGFFFVGVYQEMFGGVCGSKYCVFLEVCELLIE